MNIKNWAAAVVSAVRGQELRTGSLQDAVAALSKNLQELATYTKLLAEKTNSIGAVVAVDATPETVGSLPYVANRVEVLTTELKAAVERIDGLDGRVTSISKLLSVANDIASQLAELPEL